VLAEDEEQLFDHEKGRPSLSLQELVDEKYLTKVRCPAGGILTWEVSDPDLDYDHQVLACSVHGPKTRIRAWKAPMASEDGEYDLESSFDDPVAAGWTTPKGKYWEVVDGKYRAGIFSKTGSGLHRSFAGEESWTDYTVTAKVTAHEKSEYGIYFRTTSPKKPDGYVFRFEPGSGKTGRFDIRKVVRGKESKVLAKVKMPAGTFEAGKEHDVRIEVAGDTFVAYVDDVEAVRAADSTYSSGGIGLRSSSKSVRDFDDLRVKTK
jgi:hypothetical protein